MRKKAGILLVILGAVLLVAALLSVIYNEKRDERAGEDAKELLDELQVLIAERKNETYAADHDSDDLPKPEIGAERFDSESSTDAPEADNTPIQNILQKSDPDPINVNGHDCMGYIRIPSLSVMLPIMSECNDEKLDITPCRHFGTLYGNDLVIAGHNFKRHFGYITRLKGGESVTFTDTDGDVHYYTVTAVKRVNSTDVEAVQDSGHDLALYTCTFIGDIRSAVFCDRVE